MVICPEVVLRNIVHTLTWLPIVTVRLGDHPTAKVIVGRIGVFVTNNSPRWECDRLNLSTLILVSIRLCMSDHSEVLLICGNGQEPVYSAHVFPFIP